MAPKRAKTSKNLKKTAKIFFLYVRFYLGGKNFINKKDLFYAKFFELEESTIEKFFSSSIQPQHTVNYTIFSHNSTKRIFHYFSLIKKY